MGVLGTNNQQLMCMGCRLVRHLDNEGDHYKPFKRDIIARWLYDEHGGWNLNNLPKALDDFRENNIRNKQMHHPDVSKQLDREHDEQQKPFAHHELGRLGFKNMSPTVSSKDQVIDQWNWIDKTRMWGHGRGIAY